MPNPTQAMASSKPHRLLLPLIIKWQQGGFLARIGIALTVVAIAYTFITSALGRTAGNSSSFFIKKGTRGGTNSGGSIPTIVARQVKVQVDNPYNCPAEENTASSEQQLSSANIANAKPTNPVIVKGFPATPLIGDGFLKSQGDGDEHDAILFQARSSKFPNGPILSTGSSMLFNTDNDEHRLLGLTASLNYTAIHKDEGVESDVCVTIVPQSKQNSVSSGEEVFCTHESYFGGDEESTGEITFDFGPGGFPLRPGTKLDIASVSKIFTAKRFTPLPEDEVKVRDAPKVPVEVPGLGDVAASLDLLALNFQALIVPSDTGTGNNEGGLGLRSARSPLRDRSIFPLPNSEVMPLTEFKNAKDSPLLVRGLGIFRSMLNHYVSGDTRIRLLVDGKEVKTICPVPHRPGEKSAPFDAVVPLNVEILPESTLRVEHDLTSHFPEEVFYKPTPYDLAVYILYEHSDVSSDALIPIGEEELGNGELDLNSDGFNDFVDYDNYGNIWADLTSPDGAHDTQHTAMTTLITKKGKFNKASTNWKWERDLETKLMMTKVTDEAENWCFFLKSRNPDNFVFEYCDEASIPKRTLLGSDSRLGDHCVGDFDGDGFYDRIRIEAGLQKPYLLYFAKGDGTRYLWEQLVAYVEGECMMEKPQLESVYRPSLQRHVFGYYSRCGFYEVDIDISSLRLR